MIDNFIYTEDGKKIIFVKDNTVTTITFPEEMGTAEVFSKQVIVAPSSVYIPFGVEKIEPYAF